MRGRSPWPIAAAVTTAVLTLSVTAGCATVPRAQTGHAATHPSTPTSAPAAARCGIAHTAAGVPVEIEISRGNVACSTALAVERSYAHAITSGKVRGNGGGAPVDVRGWICQGFNTPEVLATGNASACRKGSARILAVLPPATASPSPSSSPS